MIEFLDYECPFCPKFHTETMPKLIAEYVDTGRLRFVLRDNPLSFHENALPAAQAASRPSQSRPVIPGGGGGCLPCSETVGGTMFIAVAQAEGGAWTRDGRTFLRISPAHNTNPDGSIHTYFEVYGVRAGTCYEVELRLAEEDAADRIWRLDPDDLGFRLQFTSQMPGEIGRHHLRLDLSDTKPGQYVLAVRIQDEDSGAYSLPTVTDLFVASN